MTDTITDLFPDTEIVVTPIEEKALIMFDDISGEFIIIHRYTGNRGPRAFVCPRHGAKRHDWIDNKYQCKVCRSEQ